MQGLELNVDPSKILKTQKWLTIDEIQSALEKVQFIIMAEPELEDEQSTQTRIHFTIYFNTQETIPQEVVPDILEKIMQENHLENASDFKHYSAYAAFGQTQEDAPMPALVLDPKAAQIEEADIVPMYIFDFKATATQGFSEVKEGLTGWSYVYE